MAVRDVVDELMPSDSLRRVLMIAPHFPPDSGAAAHRVRLLAPHLREHGWEPTVLTVERSGIDGSQDPELESMVPEELRVVRAPVWQARWTRKVGIGDLGLRSLTGLLKTAASLLQSQSYEVVFITVFPTYTALLGPILKDRYKVGFVLDYIDPWVSEWGKTVGGGPNSTVDFKSRVARLLGVVLEPRAVRSADAITAVSSGTYATIRERIPEARRIPCAAIPYGGEERDFAYLREHPRHNRFFDPNDGHYHLCYVGTLLPLGFETLRAFLSGLIALRSASPEIFARVRVHFFGTSNQTAGDPHPRVMPIAQAMRIDNVVTEHPVRVQYLDALTVQVQASAILLMGSTEHHYTASKLYPALLAGRPFLALYHEASSVANITRCVGTKPHANLVTYNDTVRAEARASDIARELKAMVESPVEQRLEWKNAELEKFSARSMAAELAAVLNGVVEKPRAR